MCFLVLRARYGNWSVLTGQRLPLFCLCVPMLLDKKTFTLFRLDLVCKGLNCIHFPYFKGNKKPSNRVALVGEDRKIIWHFIAKRGEKRLAYYCEAGVYGSIILKLFFSRNSFSWRAMDWFLSLATGWTGRRSNPGGGEISDILTDRLWDPHILLCGQG